MKYYFTRLLLLIGGIALPWLSQAQTAVGTTTPESSARFEVFSTTKGQLVPRMTTEQRDAISEPAGGLLIYNTDQDCFNYYDTNRSLWQGMGCEANPSTAVGTLDCNTLSVQGTYIQGTPLNGSNSITLTLNVSEPGIYNISASANGMTFSGIETVTATGPTTVVLAGTGTPTNSGPTVVVVSFGEDNCAVVVNVESTVATFAACGTAGAVSGTLVAGQAASGVTVPLTLAYTGGALYSIVNSAVNGIAIASPTSGSLDPSPAVLGLDLSGNPLTPGNTTLTYSINARTGCTILVPVTSGTGRTSLVNCLVSGSLVGSYVAGTPLGAGNTKLVNLTVTTAGTFYLRTPEVNGVYFQSVNPVMLGTGVQPVTLTAVGTPTAPGVFNYLISASSGAATVNTSFATCSFAVTYTATAGVPNYTTISCGTPGADYTYLKASNTGASDYFGYAQAISGDGLTMAVGAYLEDGSSTGVNSASNNAATNAGAVYVYSRATTASVWAFQAYIKASNTGASDQFGFSVALSANGNTLAVGANLEDGSGTGVSPASNNAAADAGAVYVYTRTGATWANLPTYLKATNTAASDYFGWSVTLSSDGNTLAVGAQREDGSGTNVNPLSNNAAADAGAVYVYSRTGSTWSATIDYLKASNTGATDYFGDAVALSDDGNTLVVGADLEDGSGTGINPASNNAAGNAGAVYVYARTGTVWSFQAYLKASNAGASDRFGRRVALSSDGNTLAVGAFLEDGNATGVNGTSTNAATDAGAAYVFTRAGSTWAQQAYIKASNTGANDRFGLGVALSNDGNTLAVGAQREDANTTCVNAGDNNGAADAGAAYIFIRSGASWSQQATVKPNNGGASDYFGSSVSLNDTGKVLSVGAYGEDGSGLNVNPTTNNAATAAGATYIFTAN